jgi:hypothetical protein
MAAILALFYFGGIIIKKTINKKLKDMFTVNFGAGTKERKDEIIYSKEDVVVLKGEAKNKEQKNDKDRR